jgi:hypothetical protein
MASQLEVQLCGELALGPHGWSVSGRWSVSQSASSDEFEWRASASAQCDVRGVPADLLCAGSFRAGPSRVDESQVALEFSEAPGLEVVRPRPRNGKGLRLVAAGAARNSTAFPLRYSVRGRGINSIGAFRVEGFLCLLTGGPMQLRLQKYYLPLQPDASGALVPVAPAAATTTAAALPPPQQEWHSAGSKRRLQELYAQEAPEEVRLRAQHWRRRQVRSCAASGGQVAASRLPAPLVCGLERDLETGALLVHVEVPAAPMEVEATVVLYSASARSTSCFDSCSSSSTSSSGPLEAVNVSHQAVSNEVVPLEAVSLVRQEFGPVLVTPHSAARRFAQRVRADAGFLLVQVVLKRPDCTGDPACALSQEYWHVVGAAPGAVRSVSALAYALPAAAATAAQEPQRCIVVSWSAPLACLRGYDSQRFIVTTEVESAPCSGRYEAVRSEQVACGRRHVVVPSAALCAEAVGTGRRVRFAVSSLASDDFGELRSAPVLSPVLDPAAAAPCDCVICGEALELPGEDAHGSRPCAAGGCSHAFHFSCIAQWVRRKRQCPLCQAPLDAVTHIGASGDHGASVAHHDAYELLHSARQLGFPDEQHLFEDAVGLHDDEETILQGPDEMLLQIISRTLQESLA